MISPSLLVVAGMAESFVKTFEREYVYLNKQETAATVMAQLHR